MTSPAFTACEVHGSTASPLTVAGMSAPVTANDRVRGDLQLRAHVGGLQRGGAGLVADEHVRDAVGELVHRARRRHPQVVDAGAALVLDRGEQAALDDAQAHVASSMSAADVPSGSAKYFPGTNSTSAIA